MKLLDIILALICGEASAFLIYDLLGSDFLGAGTFRFLFLFLIPILSFVFLWIAHLLNKKLSFIYQLAKHILVGLLVVLVDLEIFIILTRWFSMQSGWFSGTAKAISFLISVSTIKFFGNKYWAFEEKEKNNIGKQFGIFLIVTLVGLVIDLYSFLCLIKIIMPQLELTNQIWVKISVMIAAIIAALWNFLTYKFIVFKKQNASSLSQI